MAEGPQISLRTEWLHRELAGREVLACDAGRQQLVEDVTILVGSLVACVSPLVLVKGCVVSELFLRVGRG